MGETTAIEWTQATWNPWRGCQKVSPGCKHCYMFRDQERYGRDPRTVVRAAPATFNAPLKWKDPMEVFTCSWSDWFIKEADEWRREAWSIIKRTQHLTYQILTKRTERIPECLPEDWGDGYPNVWLGTSVENDDYRHRIGELLQVPAKVHFLSCEPLLGPLDLRKIPASRWPGDPPGPPVASYVDSLKGERWHFHMGRTLGRPEQLRKIDWVIAGGESGYPGHFRPAELDWFRSLRDQCVAAGVPFFLKQLGGPVHDKGGGEKALLDGERWTQMPEGR